MSNSEIDGMESEIQARIKELEAFRADLARKDAALEFHVNLGDRLDDLVSDLRDALREVHEAITDANGCGVPTIVKMCEDALKLELPPSTAPAEGDDE